MRFNPKHLLLLLGGVFVAAYITLKPDASEPEVPQYDRPDLALEYEFKKTMDPKLGYPPIERLYEASKVQKSILGSMRSVSSTNWVERGPNNFGGRTRAVMFDPNDASVKKVWAAGVTGGLWYNNDITSAGSSWVKVDDFLSTLTVNNITYDPNNKNTFYFGTGEGWFGGGMLRGNGIWKSMDAGATWQNLTSTNGDDFAYIQKVMVTSTSTVLIATRGFNGGGGIYRSTDGGTNWTKVLNGAAADIEIVGEQIYASLGVFSTGSLHKSTDDGLTFTDITPAAEAQRIEIGTHPSHQSTVYAIASNGNNVIWFYRSDDGGTNWISLTIPKYLNSGNCNASSNDFTRGQAWYDLILGVSPIDSKLVIAGGIDLHRSADGGKTWEPISYWTSSCETLVHADQHNFIFRPGFPNQALATNDGGVYFVSDIRVAKSAGGPVFEARNLDYNVAQYYACAMRNEAGSHNFLAGAQDNGSHQFLNAGVNSTLEVTGGDGAFCFIDQNEGDLQFTSYVYNNYYYSRDGWLTVTGFGSGNDGTSFINPTDYNSNTNTLFAAGLGRAYYRYKIPTTGDAAPEEEEFKPGLGSGLIGAITVSPHDDDVIYAGMESGEIYKVTGVNGDAPVATLISNGTMAGFTSCVAVGADANTLMVIYSNYGVNSVWESKDGGTTWTSKEGNLPDLPIRWALYNPDNNNEALLASDLGIWSTTDLTDASVSWTPASTGLANVRCDMMRYRTSDGLVAVATHGRGLYTSDVFAKTSTPDFYPKAQVAYTGQPISFVNASTKATTFNWNFGNGATSTDRNPTYAYPATGNYTVTLTIDGNLTKQQTIAVLPHYSTDYLPVQGGDFESNTTDFASVTLAGSGFELGSSSVLGKAGTNSGTKAWVLAPTSDTYQRYSEAHLYSPTFNFSLSGVYTIEFYTQYAIEVEWDGFVLESTTDYGKTWSKVGDYLDATNWYNSIAIDHNGVFPPGKPFFSGTTSNAFVKKTVDVSSLSGNAAVGFRFVFKSDPFTEEAGVVIDDFKLTGPTSQTAVADFTVPTTAACAGEVIRIENKSTGNVTAYNWNFGEGAVPPTATGYGPFDVSYTSGGSKTVTLTATTATGNLTSTESFEVGILPIDQLVTTSGTTICNSESVEITLQNSEAGISYDLFLGGVKQGETTVSPGGELSWNTGALTVGSYVYTLKAFSGSCSRDLSQAVSVTVRAVPTVSIEVNGYNLRSSFRTASAYQWLLDGEPIVGATASSYVATASGSYQVLVVGSNGCEAVSTAVELSVLGFDDTESVSVYPNPTVGILNIQTNGSASIGVFDMSGRSVLATRNVDSKGSIDLSNLKAGYYLIRINNEGKVITHKVIKQ